MRKKRMFGMMFLLLMVIGAGAFSPCVASEDGGSAADNYTALKLFPTDEGAQDAVFSAFRQKLAEAVKKRDIQFISEILDPKIVVSFPDADGVIQDFGVQAFMKKWQPENEFSPLWDKLSQILSMGGAFADKDRTQFIAPYVHALWPKEVDDAQFGAVIGEAVNVREQPSLNAAVMARRSYDIVRVEASQTGKWAGVILPDGRKGFVFEEFIRGKNDYSIGFEKVDDRWKIKWFIGKERDKTFPPAEP